jgi:hypothetical protein
MKQHPQSKPQNNGSNECYSQERRRVSGELFCSYRCSAWICLRHAIIFVVWDCCLCFSQKVHGFRTAYPFTNQFYNQYRPVKQMPKLLSSSLNHDCTCARRQATALIDPAREVPASIFPLAEIWPAALRSIACGGPAYQTS